MRSHFPPEFVNRLDDVVCFKRLQAQHLPAIVDIQLNRLQRLLADLRIVLHVTNDVKEWLAARGYDPNYGTLHLLPIVDYSCDHH
jgi:ATP-dependent Clp protease ATP-binding subunit ClpB